MQRQNTNASPPRIILGVLIAREVRVLQSLWARVSMIALVGVAATVLSGEYHENWGFVLVDIGEVGLAAWVSATLARLLAPRLRSVGGGPQNSSGD